MVSPGFGELRPRVGFIVTNLETDSRAVVRFYKKRGTAEQQALKVLSKDADDAYLHVNQCVPFVCLIDIEISVSQ